MKFLVILLIVAVSLVAYFTMSLGSDLLPAASIKQESQDPQIQYGYEVNSTFSKINYVSDKVQQLGLEVVAGNVTAPEIVSRLDVLRTSIPDYNLISQMHVPDKFVICQPHLISGVTHMKNSMDSLTAAFSESEKIRGGKLPFYIISAVFGASDINVDPLYHLILANQTERLQLQSAKTSFTKSLLEASYMKKDLDIFMSDSGGMFNDTSYVTYGKSLPYFGSAGSCGCSVPLIYDDEYKR